MAERISRESEKPEVFILLRPPIFHKIAKWLTWIGVLLLVLGIIGTIQGLSQCSSPGNCTDSLIFVLTYQGGLTLGGLSLILGPVLMIIGILMYIYWYRELKSETETRQSGDDDEDVA